MDIERREEEKPWGMMHRFVHDEKATVQLLSIRKGDELSLHYHSKRADYWYLVTGSVSIVLDDQSMILTQGESVHIPVGVQHSAKALEDNTHILEVTTDEFDVNDTIRVSDKYGRE